MVMVTSALLPLNDGNVDSSQWLHNIESTFTPDEVAQIRAACAFVQNDFEILATPIKLTAINFGLEIANVLIKLELDYEAIIAALLYPVLQYSELTLGDLEEVFSRPICKLLKVTLQMDSFGELQNNTATGKEIDNYRRMLLSMVDDIRVVLLKLAERTVFMRHIDVLPKKQQQHISKRVMDVFAPLANRLGILELKWELEDLSFLRTSPTEYKHIAKSLNERRIDRERFVERFEDRLKELLVAEKIEAVISGRAKHIYSIWRKMERKDVGYEEIYDAIALRVLVNNVEDCYKTLSLVHREWQHVPAEFDDYVTTPKANGYQSIHTVAISTTGKNVEVQIRTHEMHEASEHGGAAHWVYKEGGGEDGHQRKIHWLRQLLDWQREMAVASEIPEEIVNGLTENRIYVFAPDGRVVSLPKDSTPLDFAYYVHTEIGHKCRGAKINNKMVPLTTKLTLGDRIDILTGKEANPSRDWLNPQQGYLTSSRAKAKIHAWFKKRDFDKNLLDGQTIYQRELKRHHLSGIDAAEFTQRFHLKNSDEVLAAIGAGDIRMPQLNGALQEWIKKENSAKDELEPVPQFKPKARKQKSPKGILVEGVGDMLTSIAHCCKALPGDPIIGYITLGRGISIHRDNCTNIKNEMQHHPERITKVSWGDVSKQNYVVDLVIEANNRSNLLRDATKIIGDENINIIGLNSYSDKHKDQSIINISLEISNQDELSRVQNRLTSIQDVVSIRRQ
jgi:GTP pyrophosphokinase